MSFTGRLVRAIRDPGKAAAVAADRLLGVFGNDDYRPFIVLTRSRSGSNMLIEALDAHPRVSAGGELLAQLNGRTAAAALSAAFGKRPARIAARGFKIFYYHPMDEGRDEVWGRLQSMPDLRVIHLKRRNVLHTLVSSRTAFTTGVYVAKDGENDETGQPATNGASPLEFSYDDLAARFEKASRREREGAARFSAHPCMDLFYEDMVEDFPREFRRITDFLGVDFQPPPASSYRKQRTRTLREVIPNYDALKASFAGTEWAKHFDE